MPDKDPPSPEDKVKAHYIQHEGLKSPDVDSSIIYKNEYELPKGVGFEGGRFGSTVIIPVTFNFSENDLGRVDARTYQAIQSGEKDISAVMLDEHQQKLALDALDRVATQSGANIKFVVVDELPDEKGIRFGKSHHNAIMATFVDEKADAVHSNLHNGHVHEVERGAAYSIMANPGQISGLNDQQLTYVYMHEIGHALGFEHPNAGINMKQAAWGETIMRTQQGQFDAFIDNPPVQLSIVDIKAIQQLYGENNGHGAKMIDMRGQPPEMVAKELESHGYDPAKEIAYKNRVMAEAGVTETGNKGDNHLRGTPYNDTYNGRAGNDSFYANGGHDTVTDFKADGNYDFYDWLTGAEEDVIVAPEGAVRAIIMSEPNDNVLIMFEDAHGLIRDTSMRLENFQGDVTDIDIYSQKDGVKGAALETCHYDERDSAYHDYSVSTPKAFHDQVSAPVTVAAGAGQTLPQPMRLSDYFKQAVVGPAAAESEPTVKVPFAPSGPLVP